MISPKQLYRPGEASARLRELGVLRSVHTLRRDHRQPSGEVGPTYLRDERGNTFYRESDLIAYAQRETMKLSAHNPPPPSVAERVAKAKAESTNAA